jgi:c-di-GMP phosphodiesterase
MTAARPVLEASRRALLQVRADVLARPGWATQVPARAMLVVDDLARVPAEVAAALRQAGAFLGVPDGPPASAPGADFVYIEAAAGDIDTLLLSAQRWQEARPRLPRVASGLSHVDDVERVLRAGFALAGGQLDRPSAGATARPLNAAAHRICELLNHLALERDTAVVADAVRGDVALSYRLLRYVNSPAIGLSRGVESVEQGVMVLGRNELVRWLSMMLMSASDGRQATQALQEHALARGRLLELLAAEAGEPAPQALFSLGVLSMLEVLLQSPLQQVLAPLRLNAAASEALLQHKGPWADYLALASALDAADSLALETLSARWGGTDKVFELSAQAWSWAAELSSQSAGAPKGVR